MKVKPQITSDYILMKISEEEIYKRFSHFVKVGQKFLSPFTDEKTPSCSTFIRDGKLLFKDFSSGIGGDCFKLVSEKYRCNYHESLVIVAREFGLLNLRELSTYNPVLLGVSKQVKSDTAPARLRIKSKNFTQEELSYWNDYGITPKTLDLYFIKSISHYWINYSRFHPKFAFAYVLGGYKYKILQPYEAKEFKWVSNATPSDVQGFHQLPESGDLLIITSSMKDVMTLRELGYYAVAGSSETTMIPELILDTLKSRFKRVVVWLNNDLAGINATNKYRDEFDMEVFYHDPSLPKDPSDIYKFNGKEELCKILEELNLNMEIPF